MTDKTRTSTTTDNLLITNKQPPKTRLAILGRAVALGSICMATGVSSMAVAASNTTNQPLSVQNVDTLPNINNVKNLGGVTIDESRIRARVSDTPNAQALDTNDAMGQLIEQKNQKAIPAEPLASDDNQINETGELSQDTQTDTANTVSENAELTDNSDDIEDGQAVASTIAIDEDAIKSIESKNGQVHTTLDLSNYAKLVNSAEWSPKMNVNSAMTVKMQALLDWNHASPGPIDGGWGMNSKKALMNFQTMQGLPATGKMDQKTWNALNKNIAKNQPVLVTYTLTQDDVNTSFANTPATSQEKSKMKGLYYQNIKEMLGERFHMDVRYLEKLNKNKQFVAGETITVINTGKPFKGRITRVVANKADKILYAYDGDKLVATYPTTVGSSATPSPHGKYKIVNKVKMPWYKATVEENSNKKVYMLPPGPNNPVGVVWMGLSKPSYGIHGSPKPEGISRQASHGCIRLTNWDVLEVYANIEQGATVELE